MENPDYIDWEGYELDPGLVEDFDRYLDGILGEDLDIYERERLYDEIMNPLIEDKDSLIEGFQPRLVYDLTERIEEKINPKTPGLSTFKIKYLFDDDEDSQGYASVYRKILDKFEETGILGSTDFQTKSYTGIPVSETDIEMLRKASEIEFLRRLEMVSENYTEKEFFREELFEGSFRHENLNSKSSSENDLSETGSIRQKELMKKYALVDEFVEASENYDGSLYLNDIPEVNAKSKWTYQKEFESFAQVRLAGKLPVINSQNFWTENRILASYRRFKTVQGITPGANDIKAKNNYPVQKTVNKFFDSHVAAVKSSGMLPKRSWTRNAIAHKTHQVKLEKGEKPSLREITEKDENPSSYPIRKKFENLEELQKYAGNIPLEPGEELSEYLEMEINRRMENGASEAEILQEFEIQKEHLHGLPEFNDSQESTATV